MRHLSLTLIFLACQCLCAQAQDSSKLEAEQAQYSSCKLIQDSKYSGGKALELTDEKAKITFTYNCNERGKYTIYVGYDALYGEKVVNLSVNGSPSTFKVNGHAESSVGTFFMNAGTNTIVMTPNWTWFRIDYIRLESSTSTLEFKISPNPVDPDATASAKEMYSFLYENFGQKTISGMMTGDMGSANGDVRRHADMQAVYKVAGKYPALVGFDMMNATGLYENEYYDKSYTRSSVDLAKDTYRRGGFPAFTWHWRDPSRKTNEFYTDKTSMRISSALNADGTWNTSSTLYRNIIKDIDKVADYFLELQNAGMSCIFRPLHEASGGWFWWGSEGAGPFIKLYQLVFDEMVNVKGVHNVIWVWNAGETDKDWNPGEQYYDVVSADIYNADFDYSSNYVSFDNLKVLTAGKKIIALSENGPIPDIDKEFDEEAVWAWWMPWYQTWNGNFVNKTSAAEWKKCMSDSRVVTLDDRLGGWDTYTDISSTIAEEIEDDAIYDLQGRRLATPPTKGFYIRNRKVVVAK